MKLTKQGAIQLIIELRENKLRRQLSLQQLIVILHDGKTTTKQLHKFLVEVYSIDKKPLSWLKLQPEEIERMSIESKLYINKNRPRWKEEQKLKNIQEEQRILMERQMQRLEIYMVQKNITREEMIGISRNLIEKQQKIIELGIQDSKQYQKITESIKQTKRQLLILEDDSWQNIREKRKQSPSKTMKEPINEAELFQIISQIRQKRERVPQQDNTIKQRLKQQERDLYESKFKKVVRKIRDVYYYYSKTMYTPGTTFQDNSRYMQLIDMKTFIRYIRQFGINYYQDQKSAQEESLQKIQNSQMVQQRKSNETFKKATSLFKDLSQHGVWMDLKGFILFHFSLVDPEHHLNQYTKTKIKNEVEAMNIQEGLPINITPSMLLADKAKKIPSDSIQNSQDYKIQNAGQYTNPQQRQEETKFRYKVSRINSMLSKQLLEKMKIIPIQGSSKVRVKSKLHDIVSSTGDQKQNLIERLARSYEKKQKEKQVLHQKMGLAKKLLESKKRRGTKFLDPSQANYKNRYQKLQKINSELLKPVSEQRCNSMDKYGQKLNCQGPNIGTGMVSSNIKSSSSLKKIGEKSKNIYQSMKLFKIQNMMSDLDADLFFSSKIANKQGQKVVSGQQNQWQKDEDQDYLNQFFSRERSTKNKKKPIQRYLSSNPETKEDQKTKPQPKRYLTNLSNEPPRMKFS